MKTSTALDIQQLYRLNDHLTELLANFGWVADDEDDYTKLNDAVLHLADEFFPSQAPERSVASTFWP